MKKVVVVVLSMTTVMFVTAQSKPKVAAKPTATAVAFKNLVDSFSYAAGYNVANNMKAQKISKLNTAIMLKAIDDVYKGKQPVLTQDQMNACLQKQIDVFSKESSAAEIAKGTAFLEANKKRSTVITLPDGLQYEVLKKSDSPTTKPRLVDTVVVNYIGTFTDGREFENSYKAGRPAIFQLTGVIRGWTEILQLMSPGDKWKVYVPTELAYFLNPRDPNVIPPGAALIFEISLEGIKPSITQ